MKRFLIILFSLIAVEGYAQDTLPKPGPGESYIFFYRDGQFGSALANFKMFVDDEKVCKISNDRWFKVAVKPGKHDIEAKVGGTSLSKKETFLSIITEPGKSYYISCDVKRSITRVRMEMEEVTESTAIKNIAKMKEDKCNDD